MRWLYEFGHFLRKNTLWWAVPLFLIITTAVVLFCFVRSPVIPFLYIRL